MLLFDINTYILTDKSLGNDCISTNGRHIDVVRTSRQHISYHLNLMHMNYQNTSVYDNPKDSSLCNIFILKNSNYLEKFCELIFTNVMKMLINIYSLIHC